MKQFITYTLIILGLLTLQVSVLPVLLNLRPLPNLLLIFVLLLAILDEEFEFMGLEFTTDNLLMIAASAGLVLDIFSPVVFGFFAVSFIVLVAVLRFVTTHFLPAGWSFKTLLLVLLVSTFVFPGVLVLSTPAKFAILALLPLLLLNALIVFIFSKLINV